MTGKPIAAATGQDSHRHIRPHQFTPNGIDHAVPTGHQHQIYPVLDRQLDFLPAIRLVMTQLIGNFRTGLLPRGALIPGDADWRTIR